MCTTYQLAAGVAAVAVILRFVFGIESFGDLWTSIVSINFTAGDGVMDTPSEVHMHT
jgi:hypothetical protein